MSTVSEIFGSMVFNDKVMKERLPESVYESIQNTIQNGKHLDLSSANIVANAIMMLSKTVPQFLKEGGLYITSGIIIDRKDEVLACLENLGFKILKVHTKNNWVCIEATI